MTLPFVPAPLPRNTTPYRLIPKREAVLDLIMSRFIQAATDKLNGPLALEAKIVFHGQSQELAIPALIRGTNTLANSDIDLNESLFEDGPTAGAPNPFM